MPGTPFLTDQFGDESYVLVEASFDAAPTTDPDTWTWTDITDDVRQADGQKIVINPMGRSDESNVAQPAGLAFQLDNTSGDYLAYSALSQYWPGVRRKTPIRVTIDIGGGPHGRYQGTVNGWVPSWDTTTNLPIVSVTASGALRWYGQAKKVVQSPMRRATTAAGPVEYWPMEDITGPDVRQAASGLTNGRAMSVSGWSPAGSTGDLTGSLPLPTMNENTSLHATVSHHFNGHWQVDWYTRVPQIPATDAAILAILTNSTTPRVWLFAFHPDDGFGNPYQEVEAQNAAGTAVVSAINALPAFIPGDGWLHLRLMVKQNGSNVDWLFDEFPVSGSGGAVSGSVAGSIGDVTDIWVGPSSVYDGLGFGHLSVFDNYDFSATDFAARGYGPDTTDGSGGETVSDRLGRFGAEEMINLGVTGSSSIGVGPQPIDTRLNVLRDTERVEGGVLLDGQVGYDLLMVTRDTIINRPADMTLDMAAGQVGDPFSPTDDDQGRVNEFAATRGNGSTSTGGTVTYTDEDGPQGVNIQGESPGQNTFNVAKDSQLYERAAFEVAKGTVDGFRYPKLTIDLAASPELAAAWLAMPLPGRVDIINVAAVLPELSTDTISLLVQGYSETISPYDWLIQANCTPFGPWRCAELADPAGDTNEFAWRLQASNSTLQASVSAGATTFKITTPTGNLWSTTATFPNDFPADVNLDGMRVTVSGITGTSSPQTATVATDGYQILRDVVAGAPVSVWDPPGLGLST